MSSVNRRDILAKLGTAAAAFAVTSSFIGKALADAAPATFNKLRTLKIVNPHPCGPGDLTVVTQATKDGFVVKNVSKGKTGAVGFGGNGEHTVHVSVAADNSFTIVGLDDILNIKPSRKGDGKPNDCYKC